MKEGEKTQGGVVMSDRIEKMDPNIYKFRWKVGDNRKEEERGRIEWSKQRGDSRGQRGRGK
jgi:hypothetical protein